MSKALNLLYIWGRTLTSDSPVSTFKVLECKVCAPRLRSWGTVLCQLSYLPSPAAHCLSEGNLFPMLPQGRFKGIVQFDIVFRCMCKKAKYCHFFIFSKSAGFLEVPFDSCKLEETGWSEGTERKEFWGGRNKGSRGWDCGEEAIPAQGFASINLCVFASCHRAWRDKYCLVTSTFTLVIKVTWQWEKMCKFDEKEARLKKINIAAYSLSHAGTSSPFSYTYTMWKWMWI